MTSTIEDASRPLPFVLEPAQDELLSSWLRRHARFYALTEPLLIDWLHLHTKRLRDLDAKPRIGQIAQLVERLRRDPAELVGMTHAALPAEFAPMVGDGKAIQFCRSCCERCKRQDAPGPELKSWFEAWRVTCPVCRSPLSEADQPHGSFDTVRDTSPFANAWEAATSGEELVNRHARGEPADLASPIAMMRLLLTLGRPGSDASGGRYRNSWLVNEVVPGFDEEALRVSPTISKGASAVVPLHLRVALLAALSIVAKDSKSALARLGPLCRPFYRRRFEDLAVAAVGRPLEFSI